MGCAQRVKELAIVVPTIYGLRKGNITIFLLLYMYMPVHFGLHYVDTPVQYADIFQGCINDIFQFNFFYFLLFLLKT